MIKNRTVFLQKTSYYLLLFLFTLSTIAGWFGIDASTVSVRMNELDPEQEITGWGTSAAWWSQMVDKAETAEEYAKLLYSEEGLGLNVYRYNVGAGEKENPNTRLWRESSRSSESFLIPEVYEKTGELEYDFTKDANAQNMLYTSMEYGCIDTVVLFANSPHYLMTVSGQASGGLEPAQSNLKKECYEDFADYMLDIAEYFISKGVPVKYISPINEPQWDWGGGWVGQEGCHYEIDEVIEVARVFARKIKERNIDVKLSMAESGQVGEHAMECMDLLYADEEIASVMGTYAYHSYWTDDNFALKYAFGNYLQLKHTGVEVEMSEWCELPCAHEIDDIEAGLIMARTICEDLSLTGANSWSSWVAVNEGGVKADSMIAVAEKINANGDKYPDYNEYTLSTRYYAMAHYSKFIPVGSHRVSTSISVADMKVKKEWWKQEIDGKEYPVYAVEKNDFYVSSYVTPDGDYVAVVVNESDESRNVKFDKFWKNVEIYTTDAERKLELTGKSGIGFKNIEIGPKSITTLVFSK
ncbi:MAG: hypothetical protein IKV21_06040 [Clostridia bacterium]|nr:hypothetical protein [Clostridia bacterium]